MSINTELKYDKDFYNSIEQILQEFIEEYLDVYVAYDYDDVRTAFDKANQGDIPLKPVIHLNELSPNSDPIMGVGEGYLGYKVFMTYSVFVVINDEIQSDIKRKFVLNELSDDLKYNFDKNKKDFDMFNRVNLTHAETQIENDTENLYANRHTLTFQVIKRIV
ncbi:MAG: hypothetical protein ACOC1K_03555 [Nanoarchaeota archaeon]